MLEDPKRSSSRACLDEEGKIQESGNSSGGTDSRFKSPRSRSPVLCDERESRLPEVSLALYNGEVDLEDKVSCWRSSARYFFRGMVAVWVSFVVAPLLTSDRQQRSRTHFDAGIGGR